MMLVLLGVPYDLFCHCIRLFERHIQYVNDSVRFSWTYKYGKQETTTMHCGVFPISRCREMFFSTLWSRLFVPRTSNKHTWPSIGGTGCHLRRVCLYWLQPHCLQSPAVQKWSAKSFGENLDDDHDGASLLQNSHSGSSTTWKADRCCLSKILFPEASVCFVLCWIVSNGNTSMEVSLLSMCGLPELLIPRWSRCVFGPADRAVRFL